MSGSTTAARVRAIMPAIDRKVREGVSHEDIIKVLEAAGLSLTLNTFRSYLYRYRKRGAVRKEASAESATNGKSSRAAPGEAEPVASGADFEAALDPKRRDALGDRYLNRRPPIVGKKRSD